MAQTPDNIGLDNKPAALRDAVDLNHEIAGVDVGRMQRFLTGDAPDMRGETSEKKKRREQDMTMLLYLLENDAQYRQLYFEVEDLLNKAQQAVDGALIDINQRLAGSDRNLQDLRDNAAGLEDGTKIFQSSDGSIYTEDGQRLSEEDARNIHIPDGATSWEEYQAAQDRRVALLKQKQDIDRYQRDVLDPARKKLNDPNDPPALDDLQQTKQDILDKKPEALTRAFHDVGITAEAPVPTSVAAEISPQSAAQGIPELGAAFNKVRLDIPADLAMPGDSSPKRTLTLSV